MNLIEENVHFERRKNLKALAATVLIVASVFLLFFLISWTVPVAVPPAIDNGIEVNLGNSDQGIGNIAPQIPGAPSLEQTNNNPPPAMHSILVPEQNKEVAANNEADAPTIHTSPKPVVKPKPRTVTEPVKKVKTQPVVVNTAPAPPRPKAVYKGGAVNNAGGNNADSYNNTHNQGIAGGGGDQGKSNGNPKSDSYTGNGGSGNSGISIREGLNGRRFTHLPSFKDDFNQNAKVAVDITVDQGGNVVGAAINPRGTTTTDGNIRNIAVTKAKQLKLNSSSQGSQTGTLVFNFKVQN